MLVQDIPIYFTRLSPALREKHGCGPVHSPLRLWNGQQSQYYDLRLIPAALCIPGAPGPFFARHCIV